MRRLWRRIRCRLFGCSPVLRESSHVVYDYSPNGKVCWAVATEIVQWWECKRCAARLSRTGWKTIPGVEQ